MNCDCFSSTSVQPLTVLGDRRFKIEGFPNKMAICSSEFQRKIILSQKTDKIRASALNIRSHSFLCCLLISSSLSLMHSSKVPLGFTAASLKFLHLLSLSTRSVQGTTPEGVLSSCGCSDTYYLNRHMVG
jgi:hypothetical protein